MVRVSLDEKAVCQAGKIALASGSSWEQIQEVLPWAHHLISPSLSLLFCRMGFGTEGRLTPVFGALVSCNNQPTSFTSNT